MAVKCVPFYGTHRIKTEGNDLLCEQALTGVIPSIFAWLVALLVHCVLDHLYSVFYCSNLLCGLSRDLDIELFLDAHDDLVYIEGISTQVILECGLHGDLIGIYV